MKVENWKALKTFWFVRLRGAWSQTVEKFTCRAASSSLHITSDPPLELFMIFILMLAALRKMPRQQCHCSASRQWQTAALHPHPLSQQSLYLQSTAKRANFTFTCPVPCNRNPFQTNWVLSAWDGLETVWGPKKSLDTFSQSLRLLSLAGLCEGPC